MACNVVPGVVPHPSTPSPCARERGRQLLYRQVARALLCPFSEEVPLNWNIWVRQIQRWVSIAFTVAVIGCFVALGWGEPATWVFYLPLPPLALLLFTGLYLFVLPYVVRWRGARHTAHG